MKRLITQFIAFAALTSAAWADGAGYALTGVFCNAEQDFLDVYKDRRAGLSIEESMVVRNKASITCVYANSIKYIVADPVNIGQVVMFGVHHVRYRATLIGVIVAGEALAFDEPVTVFFARMAEDNFPGEIEERAS